VKDGFFKAKRPWSKYKDFILGYYLEPYIPKVATLKKPILVVDCFAGCGQFDDGEPGSPLIIATILKKWHYKGYQVRGEFIEADADNHQKLTKVLEPFGGFATPRLGVFDDLLPDLAARARENTVFLYVDPYTVKGLLFARMKEVYDQIRKSSASVELLLNLNVATFMRWGLAALKRQEEVPSEATGDEADYQADDPDERIEMALLDSIAGGGYWRGIASDPALSFVQKLNAFIEGYLGQLVSSFTFATSCEIKSRYEHQVPKYYLVYGTRHRDGVELMNDAMCKARREFLGNRFVKGLLFDMTPDEEKPDVDALAADLVGVLQAKGVLTRKALRNEGLWAHFGQHESKDYNLAVTNLLKAGRIHSSTGKSRINDDVRLSASSFSK
jgi:three-Cys-motif partner protein